MIDDVSLVVRKAKKLLLKKTEDSYALSIRYAARGIWRDEMTDYQFFEAMSSAIDRNFRLAWRAGIAECGLSLDDLSFAQRDVLEVRIVSEQTHIWSLLGYLRENSRLSGALWRNLQPRLSLWSNRWGEVRALAMITACGDQKFMWVFNPSKEHCVDCRSLHGKVYLGSTWEQANIRPRMRELECRGYKCGCELEKTDKRLSRGAPSLVSAGGLAKHAHNVVSYEGVSL